MIIVVRDRDGRIETMAGVTSIVELERTPIQTIHQNSLQFYAGEEFLGNVQTNNATVEILPESE
jgi:hypothetical protein